MVHLGWSWVANRFRADPPLDRSIIDFLPRKKRQVSTVCHDPVSRLSRPCQHIVTSLPGLPIPRSRTVSGPITPRTGQLLTSCPGNTPSVSGVSRSFDRSMCQQLVTPLPSLSLNPQPSSKFLSVIILLLRQYSCMSLLNVK